LKDYSQQGIEHSFVVSASVYAEADLLDLFYFHREARQAATSSRDREGPLELWVVDCAKAQEAHLPSLLTQVDPAAASYFIRDYVCRLTHPRALRQLVSDVLSGRCAMRPAGREVKPGIWVGDGAEIHRRARIVAPAYIGAGCQVQQDTVITRCSSIEKNCYVDCGTVVEDSSILGNTHVGIWLDVCHAVVSGNKVLNLEFEVLLEISDPSVMRSTSETEKGFDFSHQYVQRQTVADTQKEQSPAPQAWQLGANPIGGD
jgi:NDP-sugar pyrophosphorylase family protein